ncbi:hypothetical protein PTKIN_Ptkin15bG0123200 [Pterospermum kingtungense]
MNTKTMRLPPRRVSMPNANNKRKERDDFDLKHFTPPPTKSSKPAVPLAGLDQAAQPSVLPSQLLAGYLAHEFLTRRTLFGQLWDPARPQQAAAESGTGIREEAEPSERSRAGEAEPKPKEENHQMYVEVASLMKADGAHIPGIVNPSQLARFLQM